MFREPVCVRAFGIARAAHDGRYRASGEPAFMHCVEVAAILADLGADEGTVSGAQPGAGAGWAVGLQGRLPPGCHYHIHFPRACGRFHILLTPPNPPPRLPPQPRCCTTCWTRRLSWRPSCAPCCSRAAWWSW